MANADNVRMIKKLRKMPEPSKELKQGKIASESHKIIGKYIL